MASRFWVGGPGTWDSSTTTHWSATTGGAGGASVPGSADTVTFDGSSGGGTVTLNFGGDIAIQSLTMGAFTGTFDNSVNNNNITTSATAGISISGTATRTVNFGSATYTINNGAWSSSTTTGLTFSGASSSIVMTGASVPRAFSSGSGITFGNVTFGPPTSSGSYTFLSSSSFASWTINGPNFIQINSGTAITVSGTVNWVGSSANPISVSSGSVGTSSTITATAGSTASWVAFRDITSTNSLTATNSFDLGHNSGVTITGPSAGGGGGSRGGGLRIGS